MCLFIVLWCSDTSCLSLSVEERSSGDGNEVKINGEVDDETDNHTDSADLSSKEDIEALTSQLTESHVRIDELQSKCTQLSRRCCIITIYIS